MKFKKIPKNYYITILDRLTRLTPAYSRYKRVFDDVIQKFGIEAKLDKNIDVNITNAVEIINSSIECNDVSCKDSNKSAVNEFIADLFIKLEEKYFKFNPESYQYLSNRVDFVGLINNIDFNNSDFKENSIPKNVLWLKNLVEASKSSDGIEYIKELRQKEGLLYPVEKIILCEGQTEFTLLSTIFKLFDYDFDKKGCMVIPAGGKNQVARKYYSMIEEYKLPIFVLLDSDASQIATIISKKLREQDKIYIIKSGEFEDLIPCNILKNTINNAHKNEFNCNFDDFLNDNPMVKNLDNIYKKYGFGEFKKAHFALQLNEYIEKNCTREDFSASEIEEIVKTLSLY